MIVIYDDQHKQHNPSTELYDGQPTSVPEVPDRIEIIRRALEQADGINFAPTDAFDDTAALALHTTRYSQFLREQSQSISTGEDAVLSNFIHDTYAPVTQGTWYAARQALNVALTAAQSLVDTQQTTYALCRPPGHHAGDAYMGGYCYFNNAAAAAQLLSNHGIVAILDIDFHHGNGTQQLFYERSDVSYISIHADPEKNYPYTHGFSSETGRGDGAGHTKNIIVNQHCGWEKYQYALTTALNTITQITPDYLVISLGFDGYKDDPIAGFNLDTEHYREIAEKIRALNIPTVLIQEGGYCVDALGELAQAFTAPFKTK